MKYLVILHLKEPKKTLKTLMQTKSLYNFSIKQLYKVLQ